MSIEITVYGLPAPQGSKKAVSRDSTGRTLLVESSKKVRPWREAVKWAAVEAMAGAKPMDGPLVMDATFVMPRPKSAPKRRTHPDGTPDLSKLIRSTEDALTDAGVWVDDSRVVQVVAKKVYAGHPFGLGIPGALIRVYAMADAMGKPIDNWRAK